MGGISSKRSASEAGHSSSTVADSTTKTGRSSTRTFHGSQSMTPATSETGHTKAPTDPAKHLACPTRPLCWSNSPTEETRVPIDHNILAVFRVQRLQRPNYSPSKSPPSSPTNVNQCDGLDDSINEDCFSEGSGPPTPTSPVYLSYVYQA